MVTILDRSKFLVYLKDNQQIKDVPELLGFTRPSEHDSLCLSTPDNSVWTQLDYRNRAILLNNEYAETMPERHNTVYINGFQSFFDAAHIENFIKLHTNNTVSIEITDDLEDSISSNAVVARFLQDIKVDKKNKDINYTLALTSNNTELLSNLKNELAQLQQETNGKHILLATGLQRLRLSRRVSSSYKVDSEYTKFQNLFVHLLDLQFTRQNMTRSPPQTSQPPPKTMTRLSSLKSKVLGKKRNLKSPTARQWQHCQPER